MSEMDLAALRPLARRFPTPDAALAEIARLSAELTLPKGAVHVVSDVHGEDVKLRHVINNASGTLRPLVERLFGARMTKAELQEFLALIFYPREMLERLEPELRDPAPPPGLRPARAAGPVRDRPRPGRALPASRTWTACCPRSTPTCCASCCTSRARGPEYVRALIEPLVRAGRDQHLIRLIVRLVRNLAVDELIVAGDCWDRGPRGDRVVEYLRRQPNVSFIWGNHDAAWLGACLGQEALIAHVLRISLRYRRLSQLEEGYGITLQPLEHLVRTVYADDPARVASCRKGDGPARDGDDGAHAEGGGRSCSSSSRARRSPATRSGSMDHRRLLHRIDPAAGTVEIDGKVHPLRDRSFPTIDPAHPYELSAEERECMDRLRQSFLASQQLWEHMQFLVERGSMWLRRDDHLIFHGCVPVDEEGEFLLHDGRRRAARAGAPCSTPSSAWSCAASTTHAPADLDLLWYLWCGPLVAALRQGPHHDVRERPRRRPGHAPRDQEPLLQADPRGRRSASACSREFGVDPARGLIVNGHVPVKIEKGESPLKRSGKAITIDGAFSEAYGDHGYTLVLEADRTFLGRHHHFESVEAAVRDGVDIIPTITVVRAVGPAAAGRRHRARRRRSARRSASSSAWSRPTGPMPSARARPGSA